MYFSILVIDFGWKKKCLFLIVVRVVLLFSHKNHVQCIYHTYTGARTPTPTLVRALSTRAFLNRRVRGR